MSTAHIVVFGATSFVGQILCRYLYGRHGAEGGELRWAIAGRSKAKLQQLRSELGAGAAALPLIVADAADAASLATLCSGTRVVVSTVGPYALHGSPLVRICAETGTDYCDLTGEVPWISRMIAANENTARRSGARIVHCCGFDSVPSDLGVFFLQQQAQQRFGQPCVRVRLRVKALRGGFSGGTAASLMNVLRESAQDPQVRQLLGDPYALCPEAPGRGTPQPNVLLPQFDADADSWLAPFVMAGINTRVVHRSNGLAGSAYGVDFRYDEAMMTGPGLAGRARALAVALGLGGFVAATAIAPSRWLLQRFVVPKPGEGPSARAQEQGFYDFRFFGETADGRKLQVKVTGDRDPGYGSTAKILGEAAACLALDVSPTQPAGFWTPATLLGDALLRRLEAHAGLHFVVLE